MQNPLSLKLAIFFVCGLLILFPISTVKPFTDVFTEVAALPEGEPKAAVLYCSLPLIVEDDSMYFVFVNESEEFQGDLILHTNLPFGAPETFKPDDLVILDGDEITVQKGNVFALHGTGDGEERLVLSTPDEEVALIPADTCDELVLGILSVYEEMEAGFIEEKFQLEDTLLEVEQTLLEDLAGMEPLEPCHIDETPDNGIPDGSPICMENLDAEAATEAVVHEIEKMDLPLEDEYIEILDKYKSHYLDESYTDITLTEATLNMKISRYYLDNIVKDHVDEKYLPALEKYQQVYECSIENCEDVKLSNREKQDILVAFGTQNVYRIEGRDGWYSMEDILNYMYGYTGLSFKIKEKELTTKNPTFVVDEHGKWYISSTEEVTGKALLVEIYKNGERVGEKSFRAGWLPWQGGVFLLGVGMVLNIERAPLQVFPHVIFHECTHFVSSVTGTQIRFMEDLVYGKRLEEAQADYWSMKFLKMQGEELDKIGYEYAGFDYSVKKRMYYYSRSYEIISRYTLATAIYRGIETVYGREMVEKIMANQANLMQLVDFGAISSATTGALRPNTFIFALYGTGTWKLKTAKKLMKSFYKDMGSKRPPSQSLIAEWRGVLETKMDEMAALGRYNPERIPYKVYSNALNLLDNVPSSKEERIWQIKRLKVRNKAVIRKGLLKIYFFILDKVGYPFVHAIKTSTKEAIRAGLLKMKAAADYIKQSAANKMPERLWYVLDKAKNSRISGKVAGVLFRSRRKLDPLEVSRLGEDLAGAARHIEHLHFVTHLLWFGGITILFTGMPIVGELAKAYDIPALLVVAGIMNLGGALMTIGAVFNLMKWLITAIFSILSYVNDAVTVMVATLYEVIIPLVLAYLFTKVVMLAFYYIFCNFVENPRLPACVNYMLPKRRLEFYEDKAYIGETVRYRLSDVPEFRNYIAKSAIPLRFIEDDKRVYSGTCNAELAPDRFSHVCRGELPASELGPGNHELKAEYTYTKIPEWFALIVRGVNEAIEKGESTAEFFKIYGENYLLVFDDEKGVCIQYEHRDPYGYPALEYWEPYCIAVDVDMEKQGYFIPQQDYTGYISIRVGFEYDGTLRTSCEEYMVDYGGYEYSHPCGEVRDLEPGTKTGTKTTRSAVISVFAPLTGTLTVETPTGTETSKEFVIGEGETEVTADMFDSD